MKCLHSRFRFPGPALVVVVATLIVSGCGPKIDSADPAERIAAVRKESRQGMLDLVADNDVDATVRRAALDRVTDLSHRKRLAVHGHHAEIRLLALVEITDQAALHEIARFSRDRDVRLAAVERLTDDDILAALARESDRSAAAPTSAAGDDEVLTHAIARIRDQGKLTMLASEAGSARLRAAALAAITDQFGLVEIANNNANIALRFQATRRITDPQLLATLAGKGADWRVRLLAVQRIDDPTLLARLAVRDPSWAVRRTAVDNLQEPEALAAAARESGDYDLARRAVEKLKDQPLLAAVATNAHHWGAREAAIGRLADTAVLARCVLDDDHELVRMAALARLIDQNELARVARASRYADVWLAIVPRVRDVKVLAEVALDDREGVAGAAAVAKLDDVDLLARLATTAPSERVRRTATRALIDRLDDLTALAKLATEATDTENRSRARLALARLLPENDERLLTLAGDKSDLAAALAAANRITDSSALAELLDRDGFREVHEQAVLRLTNRDVLWDIALRGRSHLSFVVQKAAAQRWVDLTPVVQLAPALATGDHSDLARAAIQKIDDQAVLEDIARTSRDIILAAAAAGRITSLAVLQDLITSPRADLNSAIRDAAARRFVELAEPATVATLLTRLENTYLRGLIVWQIRDPQLLTQIALQDADDLVRQRAIDQVGDIPRLAHITRHARFPEERERAQELLTRILWGEIASATDERLLHDILAGTGVAPPIPDDDRWRENERHHHLATLHDAARARLVMLHPELLDATIPRESLESLFLSNAEWMRVVAAMHAPETSTLAWHARTDHFPSVRATAAVRLSDQSVLQEIVTRDKDAGVRLAALKNVSDPKLILGIATTDASPLVRAAARSALTAPATLRTALRANPIFSPIAGDADTEGLFVAATIPRHLDDRMIAALAQPDRVLLHELATAEPAASARIRALRLIDDESVLFACAERDPSSAVRLAALEEIETPTLIAAAAASSYFEDVREAAAKRIANATSGEFAANSSFVELAQAVVARERQRIEQAPPTDKTADAWTAIALDARFDVWRLAAVPHLRATEHLSRVATHAHDTRVVRLALSRIDGAEALTAIAQHAQLESTRHAAAIKAGRTTWPELFSSATAPAAAPDALATVVAATEGLRSIDVAMPWPDNGLIEEVRSACRRLIAQGDAFHLHEAIELLESHGDKALAETYLNCGQSELEAAARRWASRRGYDIVPLSGGGSTRWGGAP